MICLRCQMKKPNRPRGLCWSCYYTPGVREQFPSTSKFTRRGVGISYGNAPLADFPTDAEPGTEAKIMILMERAARRRALFHPLDLTSIAAQSRPLELREAG
jgi:hypothetical protein